VSGIDFREGLIFVPLPLTFGIKNKKKRGNRIFYPVLLSHFSKYPIFLHTVFCTWKQTSESSIPRHVRDIETHISSFHGIPERSRKNLVESKIDDYKKNI